MTEATEDAIRQILEASDGKLSVAEARAQAEGRPYRLDRDYSSYEQSLNEITAALLREHAHNVDVGELVIQAVTAADRELRAQGSYLTQNRPGSWEAGMVQELIRPAD